jgi:chaperonin GroEL (HSP60 family)
LIASAGVEGSVIVGKLLEGPGGNYGYNAATNEYGDMVKQGIIDPLKVRPLKSAWTLPHVPRIFNKATQFC